MPLKVLFFNANIKNINNDIPKEYIMNEKISEAEKYKLSINIIFTSAPPNCSMPTILSNIQNVKYTKSTDNIPKK